jgi:hypothetical protein
MRSLFLASILLLSCLARAGEDAAPAAPGAPGISGRVICPPGEEPGRIVVFALPWMGSALPDWERIGREGTGTTANRSDGFRFQLAGLARGRYLLGATRMKGKVEASELIDVAGAEEKDLRLPALGQEDYVSVRVLGPDGNIVRDARVTATWWDGESGPPPSGSVVRWIRRPDGTVWLLRGWYAKQPRPKGLVDIAAGRLGRRKEEFVFGETREVVVKFPEPASLRVEVEGYRGSPVEGRLKAVAIRLVRDKAGEPVPQASFKPRGKMDVGGVQEIEAGEPGEYLLNLLLERDSYHQQIESIPITLQSGVNLKRTAVPALHSVRIGVKVPEASRARLEIFRKDAFYLVKGIEQPGEVVFELVPSGAYDVTLSVKGIPTRARLEVPRDEVFAMEPKPHHALLVRVDSETGPLAECGFEDGDLVLGLDGTEFESPGQIEELLREASDKRTLEAMIVRDMLLASTHVDFRSFLERGTSRVKPGAGGDLLRVVR